MTQAQTNPFPYSDSNKRYYTYDYYLRHKFGRKVAKLPLDGGFSCPNLDGTCGYGGCIYCSERGSGDFAPSGTLPIAEQIRLQKELFSRKWDTSACIAYFQARTNTYAPTDVLRQKFEEALRQEGIVGLNVATRPDCLEPSTLEYLAELSHRTALTVELGLQSSNDRTAALIHRGHTFRDFCQGFQSLRAASPDIELCVHVIFGLPEETKDDMLQTVKDVAALHPEQIKIHLLHVLKDTGLGRLYQQGGYQPMEREAYLSTVAEALELLPPDTVICRLTGDGKADDLLAPLWSRKKTTVINDLDKLMYQNRTWQGRKYKKTV